MDIKFLSAIKENKKESLVIIFSKSQQPELESQLLKFGYNLNDILENFNLNINKDFSYVLNSSNSFKKILLINCLNLDATKAIKIGGENASYIEKEESIQIINLLNSNDINNKEINFNFVLGLMLKTWDFNKYKTDTEIKPTRFKSISVVGAEFNTEELMSIVAGVDFTKDLFTEPSNVLYPEAFANVLHKELSPLGIEVEIIDEKALEEIGMGSLLSVGKGSAKSSYVVVMKYKNSNSEPLALVGKGVTFDSGGYSLKPAGAMIGMNGDMGGAATVAGIMKTLALRKAKANVVGVVGLVENMVGPDANRPGDIVKAMNGKTIEILNTDAEGRLVLADILYYAKEKFNPKAIINFATLTGAIIVSLGYERAGLFSNNNELANNILKAGDKTLEPAWRMPLGDDYIGYLKSSVADLQNISLTQNPGSIYAAMFLKEFVGETPWAHLDIAGSSKSPRGNSIAKKGATGYGVMLINKLIQENYEN